MRWPFLIGLFGIAAIEGTEEIERRPFAAHSSSVDVTPNSSFCQKVPDLRAPKAGPALAPRLTKTP